MKEKIICPKCGNTSFKLLSSTAYENVLYIVCYNCNTMFNESMTIRKPNFKTKYPNLIE